MKELRVELDKIRATPVQRRMSMILYQINGIENALEFVRLLGNRNDGQLELF